MVSARVGMAPSNQAPIATCSPRWMSRPKFGGISMASASSPVRIRASISSWLASGGAARALAEGRSLLAAGATADRISFGNTIKKERDVVRAMELGVRLFAVDCTAEVEKVARSAEKTAAQDARIFCRILCDGAGAEWPLSRKFGCEPEMARRFIADGMLINTLLAIPVPAT